MRNLISQRCLETLHPKWARAVQPGTGLKDLSSPSIGWLPEISDKRHFLYFPGLTFWLMHPNAEYPLAVDQMALRNSELRYP